MNNKVKLVTTEYSIENKEFRVDIQVEDKQTRLFIVPNSVYGFMRSNLFVHGPKELEALIDILKSADIFIKEKS